MTREQCIEAVSGICRQHDCLNDKQIIALGNLLYAYLDCESTEYSGAVDFLWMAFEIDLTTKFELLDLQG